MAGSKGVQTQIRDINLIDMILIDHRFIKDGIDIFISENSNKNEKLKSAKDFLEYLLKHSEAEKMIVYEPLESDEEFHFTILESQIEHQMMDEKIRFLKPKIAHAKILRDEIEAELKVLAELVKKHIKEEESELLPKMKEEIDEETLKEMGQEFMKVRKLTQKDIKDYPDLIDELVSWKDEAQKISSQFLSKMDKYVESLRQ